MQSQLSDPVLYELFIKDARGYVELAGRVNGPIVKPVDFPYIWEVPWIGEAEVCNNNPFIGLLDMCVKLCSTGPSS